VIGCNKSMNRYCVIWELIDIEPLNTELLLTFVDHNDSRLVELYGERNILLVFLAVDDSDFYEIPEMVWNDEYIIFIRR